MPAKYIVCWDNGADACGSVDSDTLEEAKTICLDFYSGWIESWMQDCTPEEWDEIVDSAFVYVKELDEDAEDDDDYHDVWSPSEWQLHRIGWSYASNLKRRHIWEGA